MLGVQNIRMLYAAGKLGWNMSDWNALYDGILCFGPRHASLFKEKFGLPIFEMGYPRFDNYFNTPIDKAAYILSLGGNPDLKTIVWLPTWRHLSSVGYFNTEISALAKSFNVIVKVHPLMVDDEPERVRELSKLGLTAIIQDARDNIPLYQVADIMLFDYGGPPFGGIYTRKRFVLLNVPGASSDRWTGPDSSDIALRGVFRNVDPGSDDLQRIMENDESWVEHDEACRTLSVDFFAPLKGTSAAAAAAAIRDRSWIDNTDS
ncbi:CDP-glycerol glycerophosphotransferase family protein [bacterium]|nr:CDP-glycerol glycerophosphotransferase family protein [bacterium]